MAVAQRAMTAREWGLLALLSLLWGGSFFFVGVAGFAANRESVLGIDQAAQAGA